MQILCSTNLHAAALAYIPNAPALKSTADSPIVTPTDGGEPLQATTDGFCNPRTKPFSNRWTPATQPWLEQQNSYFHFGSFPCIELS